MAEVGSVGDHQDIKTSPSLSQDAPEVDHSQDVVGKVAAVASDASNVVETSASADQTGESVDQHVDGDALSASVNPDHLSSSPLKDSPKQEDPAGTDDSPPSPVPAAAEEPNVDDKDILVEKTAEESGSVPSVPHTHAEAVIPAPEAHSEPAKPSSSDTVYNAPSHGPAPSADDAKEPLEPPPRPAEAPPPAAAALEETPGDDSGCEVEPEPATPMSEPSGPEMTDVEQLARSVVSDTLERAKQDAKLQRDLEYSERDPDTDELGWLDIVGNGQLKKKVVRRGTGGREDRPKRSQVVTVRQSARLAESGAEVRGQPEKLTFGLGDGEVVTGLDMAVGLMQPGEQAEIYMDPRFCYGEKGLEEGGIPSNASVLYTVTLEAVEPVPKYEEMTTQQRLDIGSQKRDRGNWWFKRDEFNHALQCYRRALDFFDNESEEFTGLPDDVHVLFEERLKVHNNMAAAQMKLEAYDAALRSLQLVLNCQPNNVKALYRKGKVLAAQGKLSESVEALRLALREDSDNRTVQIELNKVTERQRKAAEDQKSLYRKMLGLPPSEEKPTPAANDKKFRMPIKLLVCGVVCGLAAVVVSRLKIF